MAWPVVFWACTADEGTKFPVNPFDRVNVGYDGVFGPRTMFYQLDTQIMNSTLVETLDVPVLDTEAIGAKWIENGTVLSILLGFVWITWNLYSVTIVAPRSRKGEEQDSEKKTR